jgi:hypothetical protein
MTGTRELADQAQEIAKGGDGVQKIAANCCMLALRHSPSVKVAREALNELGKPDVRAAALELLDEPAGEVSKAG